MTSARRLYRLNLALAAGGALAAIAVLGVALSKLRLATPPVEELLAACGRLLPPDLSPLAAVLLGIAALGLIVVARGLRSLLRLGRAQIHMRAGLRLALEEKLDGASVRLFQSDRTQAFCAGLLRPQIFLSAAARDRLSEPELRAVLAHEGHHVRRRDPLRLLAARVLADALFFVPALGRLERCYGELRSWQPTRRRWRPRDRPPWHPLCSSSVERTTRRGLSPQTPSGSITCVGRQHDGTSSPAYSRSHSWRWLGPAGPPSWPT